MSECYSCASVVVMCPLEVGLLDGSFLARFDDLTLVTIWAV